MVITTTHTYRRKIRNDCNNNRNQQKKNHKVVRVMFEKDDGGSEVGVSGGQS